MHGVLSIDLNSVKPSSHMSDRFPLVTAARTAKIGLLSGLAFGLAQDALGLAKGRRPFYIDFLTGPNAQEQVL